LTRTIAPIPSPCCRDRPGAGARRRRSWREESYASPSSSRSRRSRATAVSDALAARNGGRRGRSHVAYEFRDPSLADVLSRLPDGRRGPVVPMYAAIPRSRMACRRTSPRQFARRRRPAVHVMPALDPETLADVAAAAHVRPGVRRARRHDGPRRRARSWQHTGRCSTRRARSTRDSTGTERLCAAIRQRSPPTPAYRERVAQSHPGRTLDGAGR